MKRGRKEEIKGEAAIMGGGEKGGKEEIKGEVAIGGGGEKGGEDLGREICFRHFSEGFKGGGVLNNIFELLRIGFLTAVQCTVYSSLQHLIL